MSSGAALVVLLCAAVAAGCRPAAAQHHREASKAAASRRSASTAPATPAELLHRILASFGPTRIGSIELGTPAPGFHVPRGAPWLVARTPPAIDGMVAYWQVQVIAGAYQAGAARSGLPLLAGETVENPVAGAEGSVLVPAQTQPTVQGSEDELAAEFRRRLTSLGLEPISVSFNHTPTGPAPLVVARTNDAARFTAAHRYPANFVFGGIDDYVGTFIEVVDGSGKPVLISGSSSRNQSGLGWIDPRYGSSCPDCIGPPPASTG